MRNSLLFLFLLLLTLSCEKDGNLVIENQGSPLLQKVFIGGNLYLEYSYNDQNLVTAEKNKIHYTEHFYNNNNQLIKSDIYWDENAASSNGTIAFKVMNREEWVNPENTRKSLTYVFNYDTDGRLAKKSLFRTGSDDPEYAEYSYSNGRISGETWYRNNVKSVINTYEYDDRGNVVKEQRYSVREDGTETLLTITEYEYDNMKNPFSSFSRLMMPGICTNENNIIRTTYTSYIEYSPYAGQAQVSTSAYEYNSDGYPVKVGDLKSYVYR
jgi:hypothetical protein